MSLNAYMDLMRREGTMELSMGGVDHLNHVSNAHTSHLMDIICHIPFLTTILEHAGIRASWGFLIHDGGSLANGVSTTAEMITSLR